MPYTVPTPAELKAFYPAFAAVPDATVQLYIERVSGPSGADVDQSWTEGDYGPAIMAAAAHRMARNGVLSGGNPVAAAAVAGLESFKSGAASFQFSPDAVKQALAGGWESTTYGQEYLALLKRNRGGARVVGGAFPYPGYAGPIEGPVW